MLVAECSLKDKRDWWKEEKQISYSTSMEDWNNDDRKFDVKLLIYFFFFFFFLSFCWELEQEIT